jgi:hypothetical protein
MPPPGALVALFDDAPMWLSYLTVFVAITYTVCVFGVVFGKMGRTPFWGFVFLVPYLGTIMLWVFGYGRWPQAKLNAPMESGL